MEYMLMPLKRYADFSGRSRRKEYWMFFLLNVIVYLVLLALILGVGGAASFADPTDMGAMMAGAGVAMVLLIVPFYIWAILTGLASLAVTIRRLHDLNLSGWYLVAFYVVIIVAFIALAQAGPTLLLSFMGLVWLLSIVVMAWPGTKGPNKYGSDPTDPNADAGAEVFA